MFLFSRSASKLPMSNENVIPLSLNLNLNILHAMVDSESHVTMRRMALCFVPGDARANMFLVGFGVVWWGVKRAMTNSRRGSRKSGNE